MNEDFLASRLTKHEELIDGKQIISNLLRDGIEASIDREYEKQGNSWSNCFNTRLSAVHTGLSFMESEDMIPLQDAQILSQKISHLIEKNKKIGLKYHTPEMKPPIEIQQELIGELESVAHEILDRSEGTYMERVEDDAQAA